jgi:hypothetical protein
LVAASLLSSSEAVSTVAIVAPSAGSALLLMVKLYVFTSTVQVVNKVSEEANYLIDSASDATEDAWKWSCLLYKIVGTIVSLLLVWGSYKLSKRMGAARVEISPTSLCSQYGDWLTESTIQRATRNAKGALTIAGNPMNVMPVLAAADQSANLLKGDTSKFSVLGQSGSSKYTVRLSTEPQVWLSAKQDNDVHRLIISCSCLDSISRGPICKHAAACLLTELRRTLGFRKTTFPTGPWLMDRISRVTRKIIPVSRLTQSSGTAETRLAVPVKDVKRVVRKRSDFTEVIPDGVLPKRQ